MKLHLKKELFSDAIRVTAQSMNLPLIYIEKDYWVTFALYRIFHSKVGKDSVFKGGTALSKCYKMYGLLPFEVSVLETTRTICEKIMSLVRFSYSDIPIQSLKNKIRHTYDLHKLLLQKELDDFFNSSAFDEMLIKVANDDVRSFKNNNQWLIHHPIESLIFSDTENVWNELKNMYTGDFHNLVYGELPPEQEVLETLKKIRTRLAAISWTIKIESQE